MATRQMTIDDMATLLRNATIRRQRYVSRVAHPPLYGPPLNSTSNLIQGRIFPEIPRKSQYRPFLADTINDARLLQPASQSEWSYTRIHISQADWSYGLYVFVALAVVRGEYDWPLSDLIRVRASNEGVGSWLDGAALTLLLLASHGVNERAFELLKNQLAEEVGGERQEIILSLRFDQRRDEWVRRLRTCMKYRHIGWTPHFKVAGYGIEPAMVLVYFMTYLFEYELAYDLYTIFRSSRWINPMFKTGLYEIVLFPSLGEEGDVLIAFDGNQTRLLESISDLGILPTVLYRYIAKEPFLLEAYVSRIAQFTEALYCLQSIKDIYFFRPCWRIVKHRTEYDLRWYPNHETRIPQNLRESRRNILMGLGYSLLEGLIESILKEGTPSMLDDLEWLKNEFPSAEEVADGEIHPQTPVHLDFSPYMNMIAAGLLVFDLFEDWPQTYFITYSKSFSIAMNFRFDTEIQRVYKNMLLEKRKRMAESRRLVFNEAQEMEEMDRQIGVLLTTSDEQNEIFSMHFDEYLPSLLWREHTLLDPKALYSYMKSYNISPDALTFVPIYNSEDIALYLEHNTLKQVHGVFFSMLIRQNEDDKARGDTTEELASFYESYIESAIRFVLGYILTNQQWVYYDIAYLLPMLEEAESSGRTDYTEAIMKRVSTKIHQVEHGTGDLTPLFRILHENTYIQFVKRGVISNEALLTVVTSSVTDEVMERFVRPVFYYIRPLEIRRFLEKYQNNLSEEARQLLTDILHADSVTEGLEMALV